MTKLLSANFRRLFRAPIFWFGLVASCVYTLFGVINNFYYKGVMPDTVIKADHTLLPDGLILSLIVAVVVALFIGREYSDKTIRNKIVAGHSRMTIYLANLIVCSVATAIFFAVPTLLIGLGVGAPLLGGFELSAKAFILPALCSLLALLGFTALFVLVAMSVQNRTVAAIAILLLAIVLAGIAQPIWEALDAPKYVEEYVFSEEANDFILTGKMMENPAYVGGFARVIYKALYNALPGCQIMQISPFNKTADMDHLPIYSLAFIALTTAAGLVIFKKKELK